MRFSRQIILTIAASAVVASILSFAVPTAVAAWTATATATYTQSSQVVPAATYDSCVTNLAANSAHLTWSAAAPTWDGLAFSQYFIEWYYGTPAAPGALINSVTRTGAFADPTITGLTSKDSFVRVTYQYANGWSSETPTSYLFKRSTDPDKSPVCNPEM